MMPEYVHVTLLYSGFANLQKHGKDRLSRDVTHRRHLTSFYVCLCHCTEERGGGGGENDEKSILKRL